MASREHTLFNQALVTGYDPREHLLEGAVGIAELPHMPDFLLRWFPNLTDDQTLKRYLALPKSTDDPAVVDSEIVTDDDMPGYFERFQEELTLLEECGADIPQPGKDQFSIVREADAIACEGLAIFTLVRRYDTEPLVASDPRGLQQVIAYMRYLTRKTYVPDLFLYDIFKPKQHGILPSVGRLMLLDVEPLLAHPTDQIIYSSGRRRPLLENCLADLLSWSEQIANS